jgi:hypothetical protein
MSRKPDPDQVVAGAGLLLAIFAKLRDAVVRNGGKPGDLHCLVTPSGDQIIEQMAKLILVDGFRSYAVTIDYGLSLDEMIAAGRYDHSSEIQRPMFPGIFHGRFEEEVFLIQFGREVRAQEVVDKLDARGLRSVRDEELLALGAQYPELQLENPIIALGHYSDHFQAHWMMTLSHVEGKRTLTTGWHQGGLADINRFAAVRKTNFAWLRLLVPDAE